MFCSVGSLKGQSEEIKKKSQLGVLGFQPATATLRGVCHSRPVTWTQASASLLSLNYLLLSLVARSADFQSRKISIIIHCFLCPPVYRYSCSKVFTWQKLANIINQLWLSNRELLLKHLPANHWSGLNRPRHWYQWLHPLSSWKHQAVGYWSIYLPPFLFTKPWKVGRVALYLMHTNPLPLLLFLARQKC